MHFRAIAILLLAIPGGCSSSDDGTTPTPKASSGGAGESPAGGSAGAEPSSVGGVAGSKGGAETGGGGENGNPDGSVPGTGPASDACAPAPAADASPTSSARPNIALHKTYLPGCLGVPTPANAFDGDVATNTDRANWSVVGYLAADLGAPTSLYRTVVTFGGQPTNYWIEGSADGSQWAKILRVDSPSQVDERILPTVIHRYVRFTIDTWNAPGDVWIVDKVSEIEINARGPGDPAGAPPVAYPARLDRTGWIASASSNSNAAKAAIDDTGVPPCKTWQDCYMCTNWSNGRLQEVGEWFQVDMGNPTAFDHLELNDTYDHPDNIPLDCDVFVSDDGVTWGARIANGKGEPNTRISFPTQQKRYIKVVITTANTMAFWRIADFGVFRTEAQPPPSACML